jgi:hypothetical protein
MEEFPNLKLANDPAGSRRRKLFAGSGLSKKQLKGLILAQNERWRRGLGMQVAREL